MTERFWDEGAPYGPNGYSYGRGEEVVGEVRQAIKFKMSSGDSCLERGVMEMQDGRLYVWSVLRQGKVIAGEKRRRVATLMSRATSFPGLARDLFRFEKNRIDPEFLEFYQKQIDAL